MASSSSSIVDTLFQRTLDDLIKALRYGYHQPAGVPPGSHVSKAVEEIRREIKSTDAYTKFIALQKLCYLSSLHFLDMSWASFHAVECISSQNYSHKRAGYLAISQSFNEGTPVILLITNQLRKDLKSKNEFEVSLALECLARIGNLDLCRDLTPEVFTLMSSSKIIVRKKAIGVVLRVFERYPDSVKVCFMRLVENLECREPSVLSAVVGVFCELCCSEPASYLPLAPEFFKILVDSRNNWVLIKVLKIFAKLAPLEPRLAKKIVEPICEIMRRTDAKSLMFECIRTVANSLSDHESAVKLAVEKLHDFLVADDHNLKYLGLHALTILSAKNLWAVVENKEVVVKSLSDADPNIKIESLHLLMSLVTENNVAELCSALVNIAMKSDPVFCNEIIGSILSTCSRNVYEIVIDFDWYVSLLGEFSRINHCQRGDEIGHQLIDIALRVRDARPALVRVSRDLLIDPALLGNPFLSSVLSSAAWMCGQYVEFCRDVTEIMDALLQPRTSLLPQSVKAVYVQSAFKVVVFSLNSLFSYDHSKMSIESVVNILNKAESCLASSLSGHDLEVQERVLNVLGFVNSVKPEVSNQSSGEQKHSLIKRIELVNDAFSEEMGPISATAQEKVRVPDGLILLNDLRELEELCREVELISESSAVQTAIQPSRKEETTESSSFLAEHRKRHDLFYLSSDTANEYPPAKESSKDDDDVHVLFKLTENSLNPKHKRNRAKPRPMVVKLEEKDAIPGGVELRNKDDSLASAVRDVLSGSPNREIHGERDERVVPATEKRKGISKKHSEEKGKRKSKHRHSKKTLGEGNSRSDSHRSSIPDLLL